MLDLYVEELILSVGGWLWWLLGWRGGWEAAWLGGWPSLRPQRQASYHLAGGFMSNCTHYSFR